MNGSGVQGLVVACSASSNTSEAPKAFVSLEKECLICIACVLGTVMDAFYINYFTCFRVCLKQKSFHVSDQEMSMHSRGCCLDGMWLVVMQPGLQPGSESQTYS